MKEENPSPQLTEDEKKLFEDLMPEDLAEIMDTGVGRRHFLKLMTLAGGGMLAWQSAVAEQVLTRPFASGQPDAFSPETIENGVNVAFKVNGAGKKVVVDSRMTLLDTLREKLELTGSKKGCDHGQCGACTVIVDGRRMLSCLTLAASCEGKSVKTIEGLRRAMRFTLFRKLLLSTMGFNAVSARRGKSVRRWLCWMRQRTVMPVM